MRHICLSLALAASVLWLPQAAIAQSGPAYKMQPGDTLQISVWREDLLDRELVVLPDGMISFPLAGTIQVQDRTIPEVENELAEKLSVYLADPVVTVSISAVGGNRVYLLGKVNVPGPYVMDGPTTISQMLSLAGGFDRFAELDHIKVLRRAAQGSEFIQFSYDDLIDGENPEAATMLLEPGDVIIVP